MTKGESMIQQGASRQRIAFDSEPFRDKNKALRVLLVYKKSRLETLGSAQHQESELSELNDEHQQHAHCLQSVSAHLMASGAIVESCYRGDLTVEKTVGRVIVTVGGDGTILDASHYSMHSPIFGVNSDPGHSVGSLCLATLKNFGELYSDLERGKLEMLAVARIGGTLNGREMPVLSLNDILVAHQNPAAMSRYLIEINGVSEEHKSSGVWIAAPMGSTGATLSAGGQVMSLSESRIQYVVREPYLSKGKVTTMISGSIPESDSFKLTSRMMDGRIFFDGPHYSEKFGIGSILEMHSRGQPLMLFLNDEMENRRTHIEHLRHGV